VGCGACGLSRLSAAGRARFLLFLLNVFGVNATLSQVRGKREVSRVARAPTSVEALH
jgi:hypothetical protein